MYSGPVPPSPSGADAQETFEVSWELFGELCRVLALRVYQEYDPDLIVGIATAGVIPAAVIADILQVDFYSIKISRRSGGEVVRERPEVLTAAPPQVAGRRVLLVDELTTSGETLRLALAAVRDVGPEDVRTAASFCRPGGYSPDFHALVTDAHIVFPWDRQILDRGEFVTNPQYGDVL
jgi:hypoxanthine phosphoribosyltransferase